MRRPGREQRVGRGRSNPNRPVSMSPNTPTGRMSSRTLAFALGVGVAVVLAAILLMIRHDRYRNHAPYNPTTAPTPVLVAKQLIPKGTPGSLAARREMYVPAVLPRKELEGGAIADPQYLSGRVSVQDIFPGEQLTATDFAASDTASVTPP